MIQFKKGEDGIVNIEYFNLGLAKSVGVIEATFLQILYRVIQDNQEMCVVEHNACWFPCAIREWKNYIDLWNPRQIDRIVKNCLQNQTLMLEHYDTDERRCRNWYAINPTIVPQLDEAEHIFQSKW